MSHIFLEHTADVKFQAIGNSLEECFNSSFQALKETICGDILILPTIEKEINIQATDKNNLIYKFLEEFLFLLDSESFLTSEIKTISINQENNSLTAKILGDKAQNYTFTNDVKAVTYNDMSLEFNEKDQNWSAKVVLDV